MHPLSSAHSPSLPRWGANSYGEHFVCCLTCQFGEHQLLQVHRLVLRNEATTVACHPFVTLPALRLLPTAPLACLSSPVLSPLRGTLLYVQLLLAQTDNMAAALVAAPACAHC